MKMLGAFHFYSLRGIRQLPITSLCHTRTTNVSGTPIVHLTKFLDQACSIYPLGPIGTWVFELFS